MKAVHIEKTYRAAAILLVVVTALFLAEHRRKSAALAQKGSVRAWPDFTARDISGREIHGSEYSKRIIYVQFVGMPDNNNMDLLLAVHSVWANRIDIFIIFENHGLVWGQIDGRFPGVIGIHDQDGNLSRLFGSTKYGKHFLFHKNGELIYSADNNVSYERGAKRYLQFAVENKQFRIAEFVQEGMNLRSNPLFIQLAEENYRNGSEYQIVAMVTSFCESCSSGPLIEILKKLSSSKAWSGSILLVLSRMYTEADIEVLKSQLRIEFKTIIASSELNDKWRELGSTYTENDVNNLVFVVDRKGKVARVLDPQCQSCGESFWRWTMDRASD